MCACINNKQYKKILYGQHFITINETDSALISFLARWNSKPINLAFVWIDFEYKLVAAVGFLCAEYALKMSVLDSSFILQIFPVKEYKSMLYFSI